MQAACEFGSGGVQSHKRSDWPALLKPQVKDSAYLPLLAVMIIALLPPCASGLSSDGPPGEGKSGCDSISQCAEDHQEGEEGEYREAAAQEE